MRVHKPAGDDFKLNPREVRTVVGEDYVVDGTVFCDVEETAVYTIEVIDRTIAPPKGGRPGWYASIVEASPIKGPKWASRVYQGPAPTEQAALAAAIRALAKAVHVEWPEPLHIHIRGPEPAPIQPPQQPPAPAFSPKQEAPVPFPPAGAPRPVGLEEALAASGVLPKRTDVRLSNLGRAA